MPIRFLSTDRTHPIGDDDRTLLTHFAATGDQSAFTRLVIRHGPLVLGVCRRVLHDSPLTDTAFQATFLVLSRYASLVKIGPSLANWLFTTARRVALAAQRQHLSQPVPTSASTSSEWDGQLAMLDDELDRLPDPLRVAMIECFYREKTQDEAAKELGWSQITLRQRLDSAKLLLQTRLTERGVTTGTSMLAGSFFTTTALVNVPLTLVQSAVSVAGTSYTGGAVPTSVVMLAKAGKPSTGQGLKLGIALAVLVVGIALALVLRSLDEPQNPTPPTNTTLAIPDQAPMPREHISNLLPPPREISTPEAPMPRVRD